MNTLDMQQQQPGDMAGMMSPEINTSDDPSHQARQEMLNWAIECVARGHLDELEAVRDQIMEYCRTHPEDAEMDALEDQLLLLEKRIAEQTPPSVDYRTNQFG